MIGVSVYRVIAIGGSLMLLILQYHEVAMITTLRNAHMYCQLNGIYMYCNYKH